LGERSVLALTSQHIVSSKLPVDMFDFKTIDEALEDLVHG
jgi:NAD dependent epimerase/dehydratase family enzyme